MVIPETWYYDWSETEITGSSATFHFWFASTGIYTVLFYVSNMTMWAEFTIPSRNISAPTTTIPWSAFTFLDSGTSGMPSPSISSGSRNFSESIESIERSEQRLPGRPMTPLLRTR
ncbi:MAG: hypothetical protein FWD87_07515 [Spirochaetaceae bacterium]|nr:hypothetical protein [Spirochaetaceae bacterium]